MENCVSLLGFVVFMLIAWALSADRRRIVWRPVLGGVLLMAVFGAMMFLFPKTRQVFVLFSDLFNKTLEFSSGGISFVFGDLANGSGKVGFILAFQVLPVIVIFSSLIGLLYYVGVMRHVIRGFARVFSKSMKTSGAESLCAASNLFAGVESALTIRPYLAGMTRSELFLVLTVGMSTVASSVMACYVMFLKDSFPLIAGHLMSASLLSAPASFVICKLMLPETGTPQTITVDDCDIASGTDDRNFVDAILNGANSGAKLAVGVGVALLAFVGLLGIVNGFLGCAGAELGVDLSLQTLLAYVFYPFVWLMGVPANDVWEVAKLLGTRLIMTEIPSYLELAKFMAAGGSPRAALIASYALCGFAHVASMAIFVGGTSVLAPSRRAELTALGPRALLAATLVTLMTGSVAGVFYWGQAGIIQ